MSNHQIVQKESRLYVPEINLIYSKEFEWTPEQKQKTL